MNRIPWIPPCLAPLCLAALLLLGGCATTQPGADTAPVARGVAHVAELERQGEAIRERQQSRLSRAEGKAVLVRDWLEWARANGGRK